MQQDFNEEKSNHVLKGKYVIVRCRDAGIHCGTLVSVDGRSVQLTNTRRLWYWKCKSEHSLSGLARTGAHEDSKISGALDMNFLLEACEIIPVSKKAVESFIYAKIHNA